MNQENLTRLKAWFADYVAGYYTDDTDYNRTIRLKEKHTERVCRNIIMLGNELDLSAHDLMLAETMALLHDIGRFEQYAVYGTFNDMISDNHAKLGLRQLAEHRVLSVCTKIEERLITKAIAYHNVAALPENKDKKELYFMRLLRDADKIDIWKVVIDYYHERDDKPNPVIEIGLPDDPVFSQKNIEALNEGRIAQVQDIKTLNDLKLLQISWVFDLNFIPSFKVVQSHRYIEQIAATLPQSKEIQATVNKVHDYVESAMRPSKEPPSTLE